MTAFLIIGGIGIVMLVVSLVIGDFLDGMLEFGGDWFGGAALSGFLGAFGFGGALAYDATDGNMGVALGVGVAGGVVLGALVGLASAKLRQGGDSANVRSSDLAGSKGTVVNAIPEEGFGEVSVTFAGHLTKLNARCPGGAPIGAAVEVVAVLSPTSVLVARRD